MTMQYLNLCGLNCPQPVLRTKKYLANLESGDIVKLITTDPDSVNDLKVFCEKTKNILISQEITPNNIITIIQKR